MDGGKKRLNSSLQTRLALWLATVVVLVAAVAGAAAFYHAFDEANQLQDDVLRQVAQLAAYQNTNNVGDKNSIMLEDNDTRLIVRRLDKFGNDTAQPAIFSNRLKEGLQTNNDATYRIFVKTLKNGGHIAVAQPTEARNELARSSAFATVLPLLLLVPLLILVLLMLLRAMFKPIDQLAAHVKTRSVQDLQRLDTQHLPVELLPFVEEINRLLARVNQSVDTQRRFVADAAHELRTPLTALSLQAEHLQATDLPIAAQQRLNTLQQGIKRARNLVDQLLSFARAQSQGRIDAENVEICTVFHQVLEDLMPLAENRHIDIGITEGHAVYLHINPVDLYILIKNLADNAIRYTPQGGRVDLSVFAHDRQVIVQVEDNGHGIVLAERHRVLDPFYRVLGSEQTGSGLGLSIVNTLARRWRGSVELLDAKNYPTGLRVRISFPQAPIVQPCN